MGLINNLDTIIVINKSTTNEVVNIVHQILLRNNFDIAMGMI
ncbi:hypothetical protein QE422_001817 [Chryseobacterium sp. SORGH_AS 447]|nr:hypothetical protein [Chryseobacterium sp. SORGH_AS_0447]